MLLNRNIYKGVAPIFIMPYKNMKKLYQLIRVRKTVLRKMRALKVHPNQSDSDKIQELVNGR